MILICLSLTLALTACGRDGDSTAEVVATTEIAADIVREVAGPDASVTQLLPSGTSAHGYSASARDRAALEDAGLVVAWGSGLELGLPLSGVELFRMARTSRDPHVWMDPTFVADVLPELSDALAERDPDHAEAYRERARRYAQRLLALDRRIERVLAPVAPERRKLVSSHDSLGQFARRYGFEFVGAPFGLTPEAEPSAATVSNLIERIQRENVPAVFAEHSDNTELMRQIAEEADVEVVDDLLVESFGGRAASYEEMLLLDAERIASALAR